MPEEFSPRHIRRRLIELGLFAAIVALAIAALPGLGSVRARFSDADGWLIACVCLAKLCSCLSNVIAFRPVFCAQVGWRFSYQLAMAEQATNVLVPTGGAGGLALGAWALRQGGMSTEYIARRSVAFFVITSLPNFVLAAVFGVLLATRALPGHAPLVPTLIFTGLAFGSIALAAALPRVLGRLRRRPPSEGRIARIVRAAALSLADGVSDCGELLRSRNPAVIGGAFGYLSFDILAFAAAFAALGNTPPFAPLVFGYVIGQLGGLLPLPGGIGGTDGGLIGAMVLYGSSVSQAAAAVIIYRTFQLGVPAVLGTLAFLRLRRQLRRSPAPAALCAPLAEPPSDAALP
jgi:uncharacterized membrane protein YbhN (UPF0104 family)